ncbi:MAG: DUF3108 domain-containing protein [bacterium]
MLDPSELDSERFEYQGEDIQRRFGTGEKMQLRVTYMGLTAGYITIKTEETQINGREIYQLKMEARTRGMAEWFYRVRDNLVSYMDVRGLFSWGYDYHKNHNKEDEIDEVRYDPDNGFVLRGGKKDGEIAPYTQDVLSAVFYLRTREFNVGDVHTFPVHVGDNNYNLELKVEALEEVPTRDEGWQEAFRIVPRLADEQEQKKLEDKIKDRSEGVRIWISNDERKIPLQIAIPARVASLYGYLESYEPGSEER